MRRLLVLAVLAGSVVALRGPIGTTLVDLLTKRTGTWVGSPR